MKHSPRTPFRLSDSLNHHLNMYVMAASAAGVGMLALTPPAEAKIVYTPAHVVLKKDTNIVRSIDLNHDGVKDFILIHSHAASFNFSRSGLFVEGKIASNHVMGVNHGGAGYFASALVAGAKIGPSARFSVNHDLMAFGQSPSSLLSGYWANSGKGVTNRYLGLRFLINGKFHYGWARLNVAIAQQGQGHSITATLTGYAYETIANKPIIAGKRHDADDTEQPKTASVNPLEPTSLGRLAQGASGLQAWRREEQLITAQ